MLQRVMIYMVIRHNTASTVIRVGTYVQDALLTGLGLITLRIFIAKFVE